MDRKEDFDAQIKALESEIESSKEQIKATNDKDLANSLQMHVGRLKSRIYYLRKRKTLGSDQYKANKREYYRRAAHQKLAQRIEELEKILESHPSATLSGIVTGMKRKFKDTQSKSTQKKSAEDSTPMDFSNATVENGLECVLPATVDENGLSADFKSSEPCSYIH